MDCKSPHVIKLVIFVILLVIAYFGVGIPYSQEINDIAYLPTVLNVLVSYLIADIIATIYSAAKKKK